MKNKEEHGHKTTVSTEGVINQLIEVRNQPHSRDYFGIACMINMCSLHLFYRIDLIKGNDISLDCSNVSDTYLYVYSQPGAPKKGGIREWILGANH